MTDDSFASLSVIGRLHVTYREYLTDEAANAVSWAFFQMKMLFLDFTFWSE